MRRPHLVFALCTLLLAASAPPAAGKGDVRATIDISEEELGAAPGTKITIGWTLTSPARSPAGTQPTANAKRERFGASGLYVRLDSRTGAAPTIAYGRGPTGLYTATATVPQGGIGGIVLGLEGTRTMAGLPPQRADRFFAIDNDPFAGGAGGDPDPIPSWLWIAWAGLVVIALAVGARRARRRTSSGRLLADD